MPMQASSWSQPLRPWVADSTALAADEDRCALFDECLGRLAVILGAACQHLVGRLHVEELGQPAALGAVQVALHQAEGDLRALRQRTGELHRSVGELIVGYDAVDEAERERLLGIDRTPGEIKLARLGRADQPGQEEAAAKIAGKADLDEGGDQPGRGAGDPQIASKGKGEPGTGRRTVNHCNRRFWHLVQDPGYFHSPAETYPPPSPTPLLPPSSH